MFANLRRQPSNRQQRARDDDSAPGGKVRVRGVFITAIATGLIVGSAGGALASWAYSGVVAGSVNGHTLEAQSAIKSGSPNGVCQAMSWNWETAGGQWYFGGEYNLYRSSDNAIISDGSMYYAYGNGISNYSNDVSPAGSNYYYSKGKFAIYNGNGYNYWWTNRSPNGLC